MWEIFLFKDVIFVCIHTCRCLQGPKEGVGSPRAGARDDWKPPDTGAGNPGSLQRAAIPPALWEKNFIQQILEIERVLSHGVLKTENPRWCYSSVFSTWEVEAVGPDYPRTWSKLGTNLGYMGSCLKAKANPSIVPLDRSSSSEDDTYSSS